ncbi:methyltransferase domain-containing protein [Brevibacillus sp. B_LB10_24]|uniref:methyltransferase domain-containing protein n=1 Tax=Brevibacillus sp. B_LB10_24 TaxID=3380645 RepID=UPI0038B8BE67
MDKAQLQKLYLQEEYYWGVEPSRLAEKILDTIPEDRRKNMKIVDLGAGEGRDSVFLARAGFELIAVDIAPAGLAKAERLAAKQNTGIKTVEADINDFAWKEPVDLVYSIGALQYIEPQNRSRQFSRFKERTLPGGLHVLFAFVDHPDVDLPPDWGKNEYLYKRTELQGYYADWDIIEQEEVVFDCNSSNIPHRHAASTIIARKPV